MTGAGRATATPEPELRLLRPNGSLRDGWIAGWREHVDLPGLGVSAMVAKLDTGARTSALHARELDRFTDRKGRTWLSIELLAPDEDAGGDPADAGSEIELSDSDLHETDPVGNGQDGAVPVDRGQAGSDPVDGGQTGADPAVAAERVPALVVPDGPVRALWVEDRVIRSSNGAEELRSVIRTKISLGGHRWRAEVTLAQRASMGYPLLLGRTAIRQRFLVHPGRSFLAAAPSVVATT